MLTGARFVVLRLPPGFLAVVFASASVVLADGRVALVVGNSTYAHFGLFRGNPENDPVDMVAALQARGPT